MDDALNREAQAWVVRMASGRATVGDSKAFERWCRQSTAHVQAYVRSREVWRAMKPAARALPEAVSDLPVMLPGQLMHQGRRAFLGVALAASVAYVVVRPPLRLWPGIGEFTADLRTGTGEQREVVLADRVVVQMNTRTRIDLRKSGGALASLELIEGEAEIAVQAPAVSPFMVIAGAARLLARDARFNVRYTGPTACVTCLAGSVELEHGERRETIGARRQVFYDSGRVRPAQSADVPAVTAWRERMLVFSNATLAAVIEEVNRYRPGRIILTSDALGMNRIDASISLDRLGDVGALIRDTNGVDVTELPGGIMLVGQRRA